MYNVEECFKCIGTGELVTKKGLVKICTICKGKGTTENIRNSAFQNEQLFDE